MRYQRSLVCLLAWSVFATSLAAAPFSQTITINNYANPPGGAQTFTFNSVPSPIAGGTVRVRARGDLGLATEYLDVSMEGVAFGPLFNNDPDDDRFNNAGIGDQAQDNVTASSIANVTFAEFQTVSADSAITVTVSPSTNVADAAFIEVTVAYEIAGTGACCITASESCQDLTSTICAAQAGTYAGDGTTCATYVCFPEGACCLPDGTCRGDQVSLQACEALSGVFQGDGSTCAASDCRIKGACCTGSGCSREAADDCLTLGGAYRGDNTACDGDADGDGVSGACDLCPGTIPGAAVDADGCPLPILGDFDRDGDVDAADFIVFINCRSGPKIPRSAGCASSDFDHDNDVDHDDFGRFQRCYSGENLPANPNCAG
jgi:hypothetical protein